MLTYILSGIYTDVMMYTFKNNLSNLCILIYSVCIHVYRHTTTEDETVSWLQVGGGGPEGGGAVPGTSGSGKMTTSGHVASSCRMSLSERGWGEEGLCSVQERRGVGRR